MKTLIVYFSAESGTTARVAKDAAAALGADLYEITPEKPYTAADLRYTNPLARCNREFFAKKDVPVVGRIDNFADYDTVLIGFPISITHSASRIHAVSACCVQDSSSAVRMPLPA